MLKLSLLLALAVPAFAQVTNFTNVEYYQRSTPNDSPQKQDGVLAVDRTNGILIFNRNNNVLLALAMDNITSMRFQTKGNHVLTIQYRGRNGDGRFAEFELKSGDNRNAIVDTIEVVTGKKVERVER